jgi:hypothetical protein
MGLREQKKACGMVVSWWLKKQNINGIYNVYSEDHS